MKHYPLTFQYALIVNGRINNIGSWIEIRKLYDNYTDKSCVLNVVGAFFSVNMIGNNF